MLSATPAEFPKKNMLIIRHNTINEAARIVVPFVRKSDVRRTPNTVPMALPPNEPESPVPLLDWSKITAVNTTEITSSTKTKKLYMLLFLWKLYQVKTR